MFKENRNLLIIALIAMVNALGYGIIIPVLYSYSMRFGLNDFQNGMLFACFSAAQFLSTPIIGRMSDKFGRRPLLIGSIGGTAVSFFMMAFAPSAVFLFLARILDGLTAGNIPVAQAVISDTTPPKDRAKGFGIMGASFGFGFIFGPAISGLTVGISPTLPFVIAGTISLIATILTALYLPETNAHLGEVKKGKLFDFKKLYDALFDDQLGVTFFITLIYSFAFSLFIFAFQPFSVKILSLGETQISYIYTLFGLVGLISQVFLVTRLTKWLGVRKTFSMALMVVAVAFALMSSSREVSIFLLSSVVLGLFNAIVQPLINTILSNETDQRSQGTVMGLNTSYMSIGQILGPIVGGGLATMSLAYPFLAGSFVALICFWLSFSVLKPGHKKESTF